jgi:hypothetical protein
VIPPKEKLTICFAPIAYRFQQRFAAQDGHRELRGSRQDQLENLERLWRGETTLRNQVI